MVEVNQLVTLLKNRLQFILVSHLINYKHDLQSSLIKFTSSGKENKRAGGSKLTSDPTKEPASNRARERERVTVCVCGSRGREGRRLCV